MARDMRTLRGRRVRLSDLLDAGLVENGETLTLEIGGDRASGTIVEPGRLRLADGTTFQTPSPAAGFAAGGRSIDGWMYWRTSGGKSLDQLRQQLLDQVAIADESDESGGSSVVPGQLTAAGVHWLKNARDASLAGEPVQISMRDLLEHWNLRRRDSVEVDHVRQALAERRLRAEPDILAAGLDDVITLASADAAPPGSEPPPRTGPADDDPSNMLGLTLRSLWDPDRPLCSVQVSDPLHTAITKMRLYGYSQVPVLSGKTLRGAVTWESVAHALRARSDATLGDATVDAEVFRLDRHLLEAIPTISANGFIVVIGQGPPCGVVTLYDVARAFVDLATPFALVGDIDRRIRSALDQALDWEYLVAVVDPAGTRNLISVDQLTFGDYVAALRSPELWGQMGWWVDQKAFVEGLDEVRILRNEITHFNPDPPTEHAIDRLRHASRLVTELTSSIV